MSTAEQQQLPSLEELKERAIEGHPITTEEVSKIAKTETELTDGRGPIAGGVAATAQSLKAKQEHFLEVASEVSHKPVEEITKEDAAAVESAEVCLFTIISLIDHCQIHHHRCGLILTILIHMCTGTSSWSPPAEGINCRYDPVDCGQERETHVRD